MSKKYYVYTLDEKALMIWSNILFIALVIVLYIPFFNFSSYDFGMMLILWLPYMISHELIHGMTYVLMGGNSKKISFGAIIEKGIFYCLHKGNVKRKNILTSLLTPLVILGIITYVIALLINSPVLSMLSLLNISGSIGDIIMFYHLNKIKNFEFSEFDDPTSFGIYTKEDLSNKKMYGLKFKETREKLEIKDKTKINITVLSYLFMIALIIVGILYILIGNGVL